MGEILPIFAIVKGWDHENKNRAKKRISANR